MKIIILLLIATALLSTVCFSDQLLQYEPNIVVLKGTISHGKFQHPNGTWVEFYIIKLLEPATIKEDKINPINSSETGIAEIQLFSNDKAIFTKLKNLSGKKASVKGTLFHEHTAWHIRKLVMNVSDIK